MIVIIKDNIKYKFRTENCKVLTISISSIDLTNYHLKHKIDWRNKMDTYLKINENIIHNKKMLEILLNKYIDGC